jgi:hypothetical protein
VSKLLKIAAIGGVLVSTAGLGMKWMIDQKLRKSEYYVQAQSQLLAHRPLVELIGEPVAFGNVDLSDTKNNYSTESEARFEVPIKGSRNRGMMYMKAVRKIMFDERMSESEDMSLASAPRQVPKWVIEGIEVSIDNRPGERVVVPIRDLSKESTSA